MTARTRVLIIEDHELVREGLHTLLTSQPLLAVVGETGNGADAESMVRTLQPDLVLLDLELPDRGGIAIAIQIKREFPQVKVLILTGNVSPSVVQQALAAGADGYIVKHEGGGELLRAIEMVLMGECFVSSRVAVMTRHGPAPTARSEVLTARELEIVAYLAHGKTSKDIADILVLSLHTVRTHRKNIMQKLDLHNAAELAAWAIRRFVSN